MKPGTDVTPKMISTTEAEFVKKGAQKGELDRELTTLADRLRGLRLVAIRAGAKLGDVPHVPGFEQWHADQVRKETIGYANRAAEEDPHHVKALQNINSAA